MNEAAQKLEPEAVEPEGGRERSTIAFPYLDQDDAVEVAKAVHTVGGSSCQLEQLAAQLGHQTSVSGGFRMRLQSARMYGLLTYDRGTVTLSPLGSHICDPEQEKAARAESFLIIPLYKVIYEQFKGGTLPPTSGLEQAMLTAGVAQKQKEKARQVFQRSATQAGFFAFGTNKLVMPSIKGSSTPAITQEEEIEDPEPDKKKKETEKERRRHPLIEGLLQELPDPQAEWGTEERKKWLEMASTIFNVIYKSSDGNQGSLKVTIERASAK
jgi:hypothetical protein